jgi:hypothetical protein
MQAKFWFENIIERNHLGGLSIGCKKLKWILGKWTWNEGKGLIWFRTGSNGGLLWWYCWTFGMHNSK